MRRGAGARAQVRTRAAGAVLVALALGAACSGVGRRREPPEPALRLWTPGMVYWSGAHRVLAVGVENGASHAVQVERPDARRARVELFVGSGPDRVCGHDADATAPAAEAISLAPGEVRGLRVDLESACGRLPPGDYRYEVGYEAPAVGHGPRVRLRTSYGHVVIEPGGEGDRGALGLRTGRGG